MLFILWIIANVGTIWAWDKWTSRAGADPITDSWAGLIGLIVLNLVFLGVWIF